MAILVTGGAGFIGSHLLERLAAMGRPAVGLDNFNDYYDPRVKRANAALLEQRGVRVAEGDICDEALCDEIIRRERIDLIVHLAARAGVRASLEDPRLYVRVNCGGTVNLLELARKHGHAKFICASSSSVYGASAPVPFREDDPVDRPVSPYAATKRAAELLCHTYRHLYGIRMVCLRFFTVYGPRGRPDMAIYKFTDAIEKGRPVALYGDGSSQRDYTFISDIIDGVVGAIDADVDYEIVNLGESRVTELRRLVSLIEDALGKKASIRHLPEQPGDVPRTCADIAKARRLFGYNPSFPVEKGIPIFVDWYRATLRQLGG